MYILVEKRFDQLTMDIADLQISEEIQDDDLVYFLHPLPELLVFEDIPVLSDLVQGHLPHLLALMFVGSDQKVGHGLCFSVFILDLETEEVHHTRQVVLWRGFREENS